MIPLRRSHPHNEALRVLGETRCADQVLRLPKSGDGDWALDATFCHEWAHYFAFSATAVGILLSGYRRRCYEALIGAVAESPVGARRATTRPGAGAASSLYLQRLEEFNKNWLTWSNDWHVIGRRKTREVDDVNLTPNGLHVRLLGLDGVFRLPIGPSQIFESWAWLVEVLFRVDVEEQSPGEISHRPEALIYTWPVFALAKRRETNVDTVDLYEAANELVPHLFACLFFDGRVMSAEGKGIPSEFREVAEGLVGRGVTAGRLYWQLMRDQPLVARDAEIPATLDQYLVRIGLPPLSSMVAATTTLVESTRAAFEAALDEMKTEAAARGGVLETTHIAVELELLRTSAGNLQKVASHIDVALSAPILLMPYLEPPICAIEYETHYKWIVAPHFGRSAASFRHQTARVVLRQQWAMYEHIIEQFVFGSHVGCYGSPEWPLPLNVCPAADACLALTERHGIEFCVDADWRRKVASVLSPALDTSGETIVDNDLPGFGAALSEYESWLHEPRTRDDSDEDFDAFVAGLVGRTAE